MKKKLLLVNYSFPPYSGVGGRRWAKLAKYMAESGTQIYVINAKGEGSAWRDDVQHPNIFIHSIQDIRDVKRNRIFRKMLFLVSKQKTRGNYSDQSLWWNAKAYKLALQLISEFEIQHVIASCPPYHLLSHFVNLKTEFPHILFTADYRDMWIEMQADKGFFSHLSDNRFLFEKANERLVLKQADYIITVSNEMTEAYTLVSNKANCFTVTNGYDPSDFGLTLEKAFVQAYVIKDRINILFAGSLVTDSNVYAIPFFEALARLKQSDLELYKHFNIQIIGQLNLEIKQCIENLKLDVVKLNPTLPSQKVCSLYAHFDYLLLFLIPYYRFAFISKFYDYLPAQKPILAVTEEGVFSKYLLEHRLGIHFEPDNCDQKLLELTKSAFNYNSDFDYSKYSYKDLATEYTSILFSE